MRLCTRDVGTLVVWNRRRRQLVYHRAFSLEGALPEGGSTHEVGKTLHSDACQVLDLNNDGLDDLVVLAAREGPHPSVVVHSPRRR